MTLSINPIKFNHVKFDYYLLTVGAKTDLELVRGKLSGFRSGLDDLSASIVIALDDDLDHTQSEDLILKIKQISQSLGLHVHAVLQTSAIDKQSIAGLPVLKFPNHNQAKHIYNKTLISDEPLRSGMCLTNDGDIIVNNFVSDNAEVVASGNIHIYGEAKGRLVAGSNGDKSARIFVQKFNPQLVAIGGIYRVLEAKLPESIFKKSVMVSLDDKDRLNVIALNDA